jgi:hypothetical protein
LLLRKSDVHSPAHNTIDLTRLFANDDYYSRVQCVASCVWALGLLTLDQAAFSRQRVKEARQVYGAGYARAALQQARVLRAFNAAQRARLRAASADSASSFALRWRLRLSSILYKDNGDYRGDYLFNVSKKICKLLLVVNDCFVNCTSLTITA